MVRVGVKADGEPTRERREGLRVTHPKTLNPKTLNPPATLLRTAVAGATERQRGYGKLSLAAKLAVLALSLEPALQLWLAPEAVPID